jgi:hypothetical protein
MATAITGAEDTKENVLLPQDSTGAISGLYPREVTTDEIASLRHVAEKVPAIV